MIAGGGVGSTFGQGREPAMRQQKRLPLPMLPIKSYSIQIH